MGLKIKQQRQRKVVQETRNYKWQRVSCSCVFPVPLFCKEINILLINSSKCNFAVCKKLCVAQNNGKKLLSFYWVELSCKLKQTYNATSVVRFRFTNKSYESVLCRESKTCCPISVTQFPPKKSRIFWVGSFWWLKNIRAASENRILPI